MKNTVIDTPLLAKLKKVFSEKEKNLVADSSVFSTKRKEAYRQFDLTGFPSIKNEEWKYTNLVALLKEDFTFESATFSKAEIQNQFYRTSSSAATRVDRADFHEKPHGGAAQKNFRVRQDSGPFQCRGHTAAAAPSCRGTNYSSPS
jgi:hypothetical protein